MAKKLLKIIVFCMIIFLNNIYLSFAEDFQLRVINNQYDYMEPSKEEIKNLKEEYKGLIPGEQKLNNIKKEYSHMIRGNKIILKDGKIYISDKIDINGKDKSQEGKTNQPYLFYLTSRSVPVKVVRNISIQSKRLDGMKFKVVLRGLDRKTLEYIRELYQEIQGKRPGIKIHPFIFREANVNRVPAFVYGICDDSRGFRFRNCNLKGVVYGDELSLQGAIDIFSQKFIKLKDVYQPF